MHFIGSLPTSLPCLWLSDMVWCPLLSGAQEPSWRALFWHSQMSHHSQRQQFLWLLAHLCPSHLTHRL